jgi:hypothetical protein
MNHLPFEDWLLDEQPLTFEEERELEAHLHVCTSCMALARSNRVLHSQPIITPAPGFTGRFQMRLERRYRDQKVRQMIGTGVLVLGGMAVFFWLTGPFIEDAMRSPAQWLTTAVSYTLFILTSIQVLSEIGSILLRVLPTLVSPGEWFTLLVVAFGIGALWIVLTRRDASIPQGV